MQDAKTETEQLIRGCTLHVTQSTELIMKCRSNTLDLRICRIRKCIFEVNMICDWDDKLLLGNNCGRFHQIELLEYSRL